MLNPHGYRKRIWSLKCPSCQHEFERGGLALQPWCTRCGYRECSVVSKCYADERKEDERERISNA